MQFHCYKNCSLVDQVINREAQKYDAITKDNISLRLAVLDTQSIIVELNTQISELREKLSSQRQRNLQMHIEQQSKRVENSVDKKLDWAVQATPLSSDRMQHSSSCDQMISQVQEHLDSKEADLALIHSLSSKTISKLQNKLHNTFKNNLELLDQYASSRDCLFKKVHTNAELTTAFCDKIATLRYENNKYMEEQRAEIFKHTLNTEKEHAEEVIRAMYMQLDERDKLVSQLRNRQHELETLSAQKKEWYLRQLQKQNHKLSEVREQLRFATKNYNEAETHRLQQNEKLCNKISQIRQELRNLNQSSKKQHTYELYEKITNLESEINHLMEIILTD